VRRSALSEGGSRDQTSGDLHPAKEGSPNIQSDGHKSLAGDRGLATAKRIHKKKPSKKKTRKSQGSLGRAKVMEKPLRKVRDQRRRKWAGRSTPQGRASRGRKKLELVKMVT